MGLSLRDAAVPISTLRGSPAEGVGASQMAPLGGNIDPFVALRGGVSFQSAPDDSDDDSENDKGWVFGGALGARYWVGSNVAIEVGAGFTWVAFGDMVWGDDGAWLSLSAGVTAAFPGRG